MRVQTAGTVDVSYSGTTSIPLKDSPWRKGMCPAPGVGKGSFEDGRYGGEAALCVLVKKGIVYIQSAFPAILPLKS